MSENIISNQPKRLLVVFGISLVTGIGSLHLIALIRAIVFLQIRQNDGIDLWSGPPPEIGIWYEMYFQRQGHWSGIAIIVSLFIFSFLMNYTQEKLNETRCRKCAYILRGITEPRYPECGEII